MKECLGLTSESMHLRESFFSKVKFGQLFKKMHKPQLKVECQCHSPIQQVSFVVITSVSYPCPFIVWCINFIGPLATSPNGVNSCVVVVDYFTKWLEAELMATILAKEV